MMKRNGFRAYRKKNKTGSSHCRAIAKLTAFALLLLSPFVTHANDSTQKLRGKESDLGNLSSESIDVIHIPVESDSIGLSTGEGEDSSHLSHIAHESSMLDETQVQLKNDFLEQAKMASDQSLSMALTSDTGKPNGGSCGDDDECGSGRCSSSSICEDKLHRMGNCEDNNDCVSGECIPSTLCGGSGCCKGLPDGSRCESNQDCNSNHCYGQGPVPSILSESKVCHPSTPQPCFSSKTLVTHSERGLVPISEIEVGDYVLDSKFDSSFSRVFALEQNHYGESTFYQLLSSTGTLLELTDRHMVYLRNKALPVPARDIQVGSVLKSDDPQNDMKVIEIKIIHRNGYYNPVTESGQIVLNDSVVASSFSVAKSSPSDYFDTQTELIHWHTLSHLANAPLRVVCKVWFGFCADERFQNDYGLHKFIVLLKNASNLPKYQQFAVLPAIFGTGVIFTVFELVYDKAQAVLEVPSSSGVGSGLLTFSLVTALAVPGLLALRKSYFL